MKGAKASFTMRQNIPLKGGRSLIAAYSRPKVKSHRWVVFLTESGAEFQAGTRAELKALVGTKLAEKFNYLVINKPGLFPKKIDRHAFEESFRRPLRIEDTIAALKAVIPSQDKICLVGYSEGAYLAPEVALRDERVGSVVVIGGGTRGWLKEEFSHVKNAREKAALLKQIARIRQHANSKEKWNGFSYATWNSYRPDSTLKALKQIKVPVLSILGRRDRVIDLKATLRDLKVLSQAKPVAYKVLGDCGHSFVNHWPEVRRSIDQFLKET